MAEGSDVLLWYSFDAQFYVEFDGEKIWIIHHAEYNLSIINFPIEHVKSRQNCSSDSLL